MNLIGNIIWLLFGGFFVALEYFISGFLLCLTIIGIPFGLQIFKLGILALLPFGQTTVQTYEAGGCLYILMNVLWLILGGICVALTHLLFGVIFCITIIGIPFGMQHFKMMSLALSPFGRQIVPMNTTR